MNIFPLISSPVSDLGTELPLAREVRWDFTEDKPIWHGGNPATVTGSEAVLVWAWNTLNTSRYDYMDQDKFDAMMDTYLAKRAKLPVDEWATEVWAAAYEAGVVSAGSAQPIWVGKKHPI